MYDAERRFERMSSKDKKKIKVEVQKVVKADVDMEAAKEDDSPWWGNYTQYDTTHVFIHEEE